MQGDSTDAGGGGGGVVPKLSALGVAFREVRASLLFWT